MGYCLLLGEIFTIINHAALSKEFLDSVLNTVLYYICSPELQERQAQDKLKRERLYVNQALPAENKKWYLNRQMEILNALIWNKPYELPGVKAGYLLEEYGRNPLEEYPYVDAERVDVLNLTEVTEEFYRFCRCIFEKQYRL